MTISMGETKKLNVIINPVDATNKKLEWESTNTSVVEVDQDGNITGVSEGEAIRTQDISECIGCLHRGGERNNLENSCKVNRNM